MSEELMTIDEVLDKYKEQVLTFVDTPMVIPTAQRVAKAHLTRIMAAERLKEADWFIDVREKALKDGSYPDHAVIAEHYDKLTHQAQAGGEEEG